MARFLEPTLEQERIWQEWIASRPDVVRAVAEKFDPWTLYRLDSTGQRVTLAAFFEDGTLSVNVLGDYNAIFFERQVFGIKPENLTECDLPADDEVRGVVMDSDDVTPELLREIGKTLGIVPRDGE